MWQCDIPGFGALALEHLVCDYNGTLAEDGRLLPGVPARLQALANDWRITLVTADTHGTVREALADLPVHLALLHASRETPQDVQKCALVERLGAEHVAAVGNGRNDRAMLRAARLGIALVQGEGAAADTLAAADVVCREATDALDLLRYPQRLVATLRC